MEAIPLLLLFIGVLVVSAIGRAFRQLHANALKAFADRHGLQFVPGTATFGLFPGYPRVEGHIGSASIVVDTYASGSGKNRRTYTRLRVRDPEALSEGQVAHEGVLSALGKLVGRGEVVLGDRSFDDAMLLRGDPADLRARLGVSGRKAVSAAVQYGWELHEREWVYKAGRLERDPDRLTRHLARALAVSRETRLEDGGVLPTLWKVATTDPVPRVRAGALTERLMRRPLPTDDELAVVIAGGGPAAVVAAVALSDGGATHLRRLLADPEAALPAAVALAARGQGGPEVEGVLVAALADEAQVDDAIEALEKVGTVRAVAALGPLSGALLPSARKTAATRAVRAIQSRLSGDAGDLSMADLSGGELSMAEAARRRGLQAE